MSLASLNDPAYSATVGADPEQLVAALNRAGELDGNLTAVRAQPLAPGLGAFSRLVRLELTYRAPDPGLPRSFILKLPSAVSANLERARAYDLYRREALFYRDVAPTVGLRVPRCLWSSIESEPSSPALLLEDLGNLSKGDQLVGISRPRALIVVSSVAAMHAQWWEAPQLAALSWLPCLGGWMKGELVRAYRAQWPGFARMYASDLGPDELDAGTGLCDELEPLLRELSASPRTLVHGDLRAENLFFDDRPGGDDVAVIDWQLCCRGCGAFDVAYLLCQSMTTAARRRSDAAILRAWHDALCARGVNGYSLDDAVRDYARGVRLCLVYAVVGSALERVSAREQALVRMQVTRTMAAVRDLGGSE